MTTTTVGATLLPLMATYLAHSTLLLGAAWALGRHVLRGDAWRETLWKAALVGGLVTSIAAQVVPWTPVRVTLPEATVAGPQEGAESGQALARAQASPVADPRRAAERAGDPLAGGSPAADRAPDPAATNATRPKNEAGVRTGSEESTAGARDRSGGMLGSSDRAAATGPSWTGAILLVWAAIAALLVARLAGRRWRLSRLLRGRRRVVEGHLPAMLAQLRRAAGIWAPVRLSRSSAISSPLVLGRGEICVPERFLTELSRDEQRAALAHELAHLARRDPAWLLCAMLLERVFFFQPLHRVARRGLRETAEYLSDAWAVRLSGDRLPLARCLAEVAAWVAPPDEPALAEAVAMTEGGSPLLNRIRRLLETETETAPEPRGALRAAAAAALIMVAGVIAPAVTASAEAPVVTASAETSAVTPSAEAPDDPAPARASSDASRTNGEAGPLEGPGSDEPPEAEEPAPPGDDPQEASVVRAPADGDLTSGLSWAADRAAAGRAGTYWVAWAVPSALPLDTHVSVDSRNGMNIHVTDEPYPRLELFGGGGAAANVLGVADELEYGRDGYDVLILAELGGAAEEVVRLAVRSPLMPLRLSGAVHWLGRARADESLQWLERLHETAPDRRLGETAIEAAAIHPGPDAPRFLRTVAGIPDAGREMREQAVEGLAFHPADENLDFLVRLAEDDADPTLRAEAVETLGELRHAGAPDALRGFLRTGDVDVRAEALESLSEQVRDTTVILTLLEVAMNDPEPDLRREAVELIGEMPSTEAVPALRRLASESTDPQVLREVAEQLGEVGSTEALAALEEIASTSADREVVLEAVEAIADGFPTDVARPRLEAISRDHASAEVRREALEELMDMHVAEGSGDVLLQMALEDEDPDLRRDAVERLSDLPATEAVPLLRRAALESGDGIVARQVAESLGDVGTDEALAALDEILERDLGDDVSQRAVEAIAEGFSRDLALPRLRRILNEHPSIRVRREALDRLADLGG